MGECDVHALPGALRRAGEGSTPHIEDAVPVFPRAKGRAGVVMHRNAGYHQRNRYRAFFPCQIHVCWDIIRRKLIPASVRSLQLEIQWLEQKKKKKKKKKKVLSVHTTA